MDSGQRQPLLLTSGQGRGGMVVGQIEAHGRQRSGDPVFDDISGQPQILHAEGDIVTDAGEDHLRIGILQNQPGITSARVGWTVTDAQLAGGLTGLGRQNPGDCM